MPKLTVFPLWHSASNLLITWQFIKQIYPYIYRYPFSFLRALSDTHSNTKFITTYMNNKTVIQMLTRSSFGTLQSCLLVLYTPPRSAGWADHGPKVLPVNCITGPGPLGRHIWRHSMWMFNCWGLVLLEEFSRTREHRNQAASKQCTSTARSLEEKQRSLTEATRAQFIIWLMGPRHSPLSGCQRATGRSPQKGEREREKCRGSFDVI